MRTSAAEWAGHASAKVRITAAMTAIRDRLLIRASFGEPGDGCPSVAVYTSKTQPVEPPLHRRTAPPR
jgi:hypothetical protein